MIRAMRPLRRPGLFLSLFRLTAALSGATLAGTAGAVTPINAATPPDAAHTLKHVYVIVLENKSIENTIGNLNMPKMNALAKTYGYAANYTGELHPSLPNYVAMIAGSTLNFTSNDPTRRFADDNLALQLTRANLTWRGYFQGLPNNGSVADYAGAYGKKHNPFMLSSAVLADPKQVANVQTLASLGPDLDAGRSPNFAFIVPDVCNDMHGAPECRDRARLDQDGDAFVGTWTKRIMASPDWKPGSAIVVTFDEGGGGDKRGGGGRIATIVITASGPRGVVSRAAYTHYSLLRTLEDGFGLPALLKAKTATPMTDLFWKPGKTASK
jgi:phosphatidylinositol-3-phosphatase